MPLCELTSFADSEPYFEAWRSFWFRWIQIITAEQGTASVCRELKKRSAFMQYALPMMPKSRKISRHAVLDWVWLQSANFQSQIEFFVILWTLYSLGSGSLRITDCSTPPSTKFVLTDLNTIPFLSNWAQIKYFFNCEVSAILNSIFGCVVKMQTTLKQVTHAFEESQSLAWRTLSLVLLFEPVANRPLWALINFRGS